MRQALARRRRIVAAVLLLTLLALPAPELAIAPPGAGDTQLAVAATTARGGVAPTPPPIRARGPQPVDLPPMPPAPSVDRTADPALAQRLQEALDAALTASEAYGISVAVVREGGVVWRGAAGTRGATGEPLEVDDPMVIGSITKTFVAAAVLQLAEEGRIEIDEPARRYLPDLGLGDEVNVRQLLDHTSGLADLFNDATRTAIEEHPEQAWTPLELMETLHEPWYAPGEGWAYANTNYLLLSLLVEKMTGAPLAEELDDRFLRPLELESTQLIAVGDGDSALGPAWASIFWGSGAMVSTAGDLARWGDALYAGEVLDEGARRTMLVFNDHDHGLGVQRLELGGVTGYGHTGLLDHYTTLLLHLPREQVTIALLVNRSRVDLGAILQAGPDGAPSLIELVGGRP